MAPQETQYVQMKEEKSRTAHVLIAVGLCALVGAAFFVVQPGQTNVNSSINAQLDNYFIDPGFSGDDLPKAFPDCQCTGDCLVTDNELGLATCAVADDQCMGVDYVQAQEQADGTFKAVCEILYGGYDCMDYPCIHGGFCIDGRNDYTCYCKTGWGGRNCEEDINECEIVDDTDLGQIRVCDDNARCINNDGGYTCECNGGWEGRGYRAADTEVGGETLGTPYWMANADDSQTYNCADINHCAANPCKNGATCNNAIGVVDGWSCTCPQGPAGYDAYVGRDCGTDVNECDVEDEKHDCDPKAVCINNDGGFTCTCNDHWTPYNGDTDFKGRSNQLNDDSTGNLPGCYDIDDCAELPCANGGTCTEGQPGCEDARTGLPVDCYSCFCTYGWSGFNCEKDENECRDSDIGAYSVGLHSCDTNSLCTNTPGSFECACNAGWTGDGVICWDADDCEYSPCAHGGTCNDCGTLCFACDCVKGWRGVTCGVDWNECIMGVHQCNDDATCINNPGSYTCRCDPGFTGTGIGHSSVYVTETVTNVLGVDEEVSYWQGCADIDDCDPDLYDFVNYADGPCMHGYCEDNGQTPTRFVCFCEGTGYTDSNCDRNINECDKKSGSGFNVCSSNAKCIDQFPQKANGYVDKFECICNTGYEGNGESCNDINDCTDADGNYVCGGYGFCTDLGVNAFKCICNEGYEDALCDSDINECADFLDDCGYNANCINTPGSYTCECKTGYAGSPPTVKCIDIDDCVNEPCNKGTCTDEGANSYSCECNEGWTDFNCDYDIDECYLKAHDCHEDAKCINKQGTYHCRCLNGFYGDGRECTDIDDCDPDPCSPEHGTCEDLGPNKYECICDPGFGCYTLDCEGECDECTDGTHGCDGNAACTNTYGSYTCECLYPAAEEENAPGFYGDGINCAPCTVCQDGWKANGICQSNDRDCINIDECVLEIDNCDENAACDDTEGSFTCECNQGSLDDEWWGKGVVGSRGAPGCFACTKCQAGFHEVQPCTSTTDRICRRDIPATVLERSYFDYNNGGGRFTIESEADDNRQCLTIQKGDWYPSRLNLGNQEKNCGVPEDHNVKNYGEFIWKFTGLGDNTPEDGLAGVSDLYTINYAGKCLFFGDMGNDIYPSLQHCKDYEENMEMCPWSRPREKYCGFGRNELLTYDYGYQAVWRITPLKLNDRKFIIQSSAHGVRDGGGQLTFECLAFEKNGAATNPSRYNWGNGDAWCGAGDWEGQGKDIALLNNKQAVFIIIARK